MDQSQDFKSLQDSIQESLISITRSSGQISSEDLGFQRSLNPEVGTALDEQSSRLLSLSSALLKSATSLGELRAPVLEDAEDVENDWRSVVDVLDSLLEKADTCLDEYTGVLKRRETQNSPNPDQTKAKPKQAFLGNAFRSQNLVKPQLGFDVKPDNTNTSPWKPLLKSKPHATKALEDSLDLVTTEYGQKQYKHPYEMEISQLSYPKAAYQSSEPIPYQPVDTTSATFVDTYDGVLEMLKELKGTTEIAIDLEHHDNRSYVGLVSLMQISTREKDWIVDTLKPWRQDLQVLNEVFANPKIIKVFHGAFMDIIWLQRDLGLYVVGLFDTFHAARALGYAGASLAFLLKKFIDFDADKKYQMADWRVRPLPEEMFFYARADTHFLLYIYDNMRNELIDRSDFEVPEENKLEIVLQRSKETSLDRFQRQVYDSEGGHGPGGWYQLLTKTPALFNKEQFSVFRAVHEWRDQIARKDDESTNFVMPNHFIFNVAKLLPIDMVALLSIVHPISFAVKSRKEELLAIIKSAKSRGNEGPTMMEVLHPNSVGAVAKANLPSAGPQSTSTTLVTATDESQLRSEMSLFWGEAFGSSLWDGPGGKPEDDLRLAVPLPQLASEVFEPSNASSALADRSREQAVIPIQPRTPPVKKADEVFTIKHGKKRKSDHADNATIPSPEDTPVITANDDDEVSRKKARKAEKKALKQARKLAEKASNEGVAAKAEEEEEEEDQAPFDYSKADSVLNAKREKPQFGDGKGKKKKPFDPYKKSEDAAKGMRKAQVERPGRSHTFKT